MAEGFLRDEVLFVADLAVRFLVPSVLLRLLLVAVPNLLFVDLVRVLLVVLLRLLFFEFAMSRLMHIQSDMLAVIANFVPAKSNPALPFLTCVPARASQGRARLRSRRGQSPMCFQLYAGTNGPLPRSDFDRSDPHVHVRDLADSDAWARSIFTKPEVQYIGSSTSCGCAFPSVMHQNGGWPYWLDPLKDADEIAESKQECEELCRLLSQHNEDEVELYGIWAGNEGAEPLIREEITLDVSAANSSASKRVDSTA